MFGQFLASFSVAHPVPEGIGLRELALDVHAWTARIKRDKLYLQTIMALGLSGLMWPFLSGPRREGLYAKYYPVWGGVTPLNVDALWGKSGRNGVQSLGVLPGGSHRAALSARLRGDHRAGHHARRGVVPDRRLLADDGGRCDGGVPPLHRQPEGSRRLRFLSTVLGILLLLGAAGCATPPAGGPAASSQRDLEQYAALRSTAVDPAVAQRILALDPDRVTDADVRTALAAGPTPRIIGVHGGIYPVHLVMESFARFLVGMGYPEAKIRHPGDGRLSHSPYESSARIAGTLAWYYEHEATMPMIIGHSQGGIQAVKVLYEPRRRVRRSHPGLEPGDRFAGGPGHDHRSVHRAAPPGPRPARGLRVGRGCRRRRTASPQPMVDGRPAARDAGHGRGVHRLLARPRHDRLGFLGSASDFRANGKASVRNVRLPADYSHVTVAVTSDLARSPAMREWLNDYRPGQVNGVPVAEGPTDNALWAADVWFNIKRHWAIEAQKVIRAQRALAGRH